MRSVQRPRLTRKQKAQDTVFSFSTSFSACRKNSELRSQRSQGISGRKKPAFSGGLRNLVRWTSNRRLLLFAALSGVARPQSPFVAYKNGTVCLTYNLSKF